MASNSSRWHLPFEAVLRQILNEYDGVEAKVRNGMEDGMRKLFQKPYEEEIHALRGAVVSVISTEEAQQVIFFPRLSDMRTYATTFAKHTPDVSKEADPAGRRERVVKFKLLSVFYTVHRKDGALMDRFMHSGGLQSLVNLLAEDNNVIQSQAIELLIELLSPLMTHQPAASDRQRHLYHEIFLCLRSEAFWRNLAKIISEPHEVFPNSHANCVKLMAGAVGWLRPEELGEAAEVGSCGPRRVESLLPATAEVQTALSTLIDGGLLKNPQERGIAVELLEAFREVPIVRQDPLQGSDLARAREALFAASAEAREDAAHAWQSLRRLGNDAFRYNLIWPAEASYRMALELGKTSVPATEASLIHSNRALAFLKAGHHFEAAAAAEWALEHDPRNAKAAYRRAQALLELPGAGFLDVQAAVECASLAARLEPKDTRVADMLHRAEARLQELKLKQPEEASMESPKQVEDPEPVEVNAMD